MVRKIATIAMTSPSKTNEHNSSLTNTFLGDGIRNISSAANTTMSPIKILALSILATNVRISLAFVDI